MPTRLLYEKICDSATLAQLTGDEERLFHRLVVKADDYGRFHAHPSLLLGHCFPLLVEKVGADQVRAWRDRLVEVGLIRVYEVDGREYLEMVTWSSYQRQRASKPKYPDPPADVSELPQVAADGGHLSLARRQDTLAGGRRPEAGTRGPEAGTPPKPSPPSGEGQPPAAARRGRARSRERANGVLPHPPADPPPKLEPGEEWIEPGHPEYSPLVGRYKRVRV